MVKVVDVFRIERLRESYVFNLYEALGHIYRIFGLSVINFLEPYSDPEESWEEFFTVIKSPYRPEKARELIDRLGNEWFLNIPVHWFLALRKIYHCASG